MVVDIVSDSVGEMCYSVGHALTWKRTHALDAHKHRARSRRENRKISFHSFHLLSLNTSI